MPRAQPASPLVLSLTWARALRGLLRHTVWRRELAALTTGAALLAAGCGAERATDPAIPAKSEQAAGAARQLGPRYGIAVTLPAGWEGRLGRGALHAASFPLAAGVSPWTPEAGTQLRPDDVLVAVFENELRRSPPLEVADFERFDGITEDSRTTGHGFARRTFQVAGRFFVLFAETGKRNPSPSLLGALNELLGSFSVEPGDFFPGTVEPGRFTDRAGWFVGTSGEDDVRAEGEFTTAWASTIPYADGWNALPPVETLERLPRDAIVVWLGLSRSNHFPPDLYADEGFPAQQPFSLEGFERRAGWEGQVRDLPEYVLWATVPEQYQVDLRLYFGRPDPTETMRAEAQAVLDGLELPDWGPWEIE
jgi:hypothetical protein